jgi:hypothetical protein
MNISKYTKAIKENEQSFCDRFIIWDIMDDSLQVWFNFETVKINYVTFEGHHITDDIKFWDFIQWYRELIF